MSGCDTANAVDITVASNGMVSKTMTYTVPDPGGVPADGVAVRVRAVGGSQSATLRVVHAAGVIDWEVSSVTRSDGSVEADPGDGGPDRAGARRRGGLRGGGIQVDREERDTGGVPAA